jgi:Ca-activated chloride channel homolog
MEANDVAASEEVAAEPPAERPAAASRPAQRMEAARDRVAEKSTLDEAQQGRLGGGYRAEPEAPDDADEDVALVVERGLQFPCSDASARGLAHRRRLWRARLATVSTMEDALRVYEASVGHCEVPGWRDERTFLQLLQARVATERDVRGLLRHFAGEPDASNYLARALLRRLVDPALVAAVLNTVYGDAVDWIELDHRVLLARDTDEKLRILREALARAPGDPEGERRLLELQIRSGQLADALVRGNRLRDRGMMTPELAQTLGEALVRRAAPCSATSSCATAGTTGRTANTKTSWR